MKRFKIGFLAVVAILAISLTAATKADVLKSRQTVTCFANTDYFSVNIGGLNYYNPQFTPIPPAPNTTACPGHTSLFCATLITTLPQNVTCPGGNTFCCAKVVSPNTCAPLVKVQTFCKQ
jgi:hypothetical protein